MKRILFVTVLGFFTLNTIAQKEKKKTVQLNNVPELEMKNAIDSFSYAAGVNIAKNMQGQGIEKLNSELLKRAVEDVLSNRKLLMEEQQCNMTLQQKLQQFQQAKLHTTKAAGEAFLAKNKTRQGVTVLPNGLQYEIVKAGDGPKPTEADTVVVHYTGTLIDGTEFDSSVKRGEPATFPLKGVIKGWTEILQLMPKGSKWKVYIPSDLAYGERAAGQLIKPGSTLIFDIDLIDIKPAIAN
ncbi:MAG TPA: FKBP-type peptidyl-prolyl cis-trans isomerase [Ferruginibacter sp.]|nr:FKBP-type peptidyl-prolyl cis-trans isomerase [Chitinophagaceae bacterium]HQY40746.1 FKBP-type peptidyl-prolyl cis-trans isomerase [Ferruginibacter sp.]HRB30705.1 FKBP-type peptidyl-prolyl cis-trans isomerase [Ferruginibacter sp.]